MSRFPKLTSVKDLEPVLVSKPEIRLMSGHPGGFSVACYLISAENTFDSPFARECRGLTFAADGTVAGRPLHKFFNVNERAETQFHALPWDRVVRVMDKRDGSMIHTVIDPEYPSGFRLKSKKSFTWMGCADAETFAIQHREYHDLCKWAAKCKHTAIFEWTAPDYRIVLQYPGAELRLLHVRDNATGEYLNLKELATLAERFGVKLVDEYPLGVWTPEVLEAAARTARGVEGWVIQFADGEMVKLKTQWYINLHHSMTFLRERDVAELVLAEQIDDLKAKLSGEGIDLAPILEVEARLIDRIRSLEDQVLALYLEAIKLPDRKTVAQTYQGHSLFGLLMQKYSNREPDVMEHFRKRYLDEEFTLRQLVLTNRSEDT